jgi:hypothetical protein
MFEFYMEAAGAELPKLSQTSLFIKMNQGDSISNAIKSEIGSASKYIVKPDEIQEILALMRLNGDQSMKKVLKAYEMGDVVLLFHKDNNKIPTALPYIIIGKDSKTKAFVFVDKVATSVTSQREYTNIMAAMESAYYALMLYRNPGKFIANRQLMQIICNIYAILVTLPLEQRVYMKGDYLTKAMLYSIAYFYRMIDGPDKVTTSTIPYKRIISDKISEGVVKEVFAEVAEMEDPSFINLVKIIENINPLRYKDLDAMYLSHYTTSCGATVIFALENVGYMFLPVFSSIYKSQLTQYNLNKTVTALAKKAASLLAMMS